MQPLLVEGTYNITYSQQKLLSTLYLLLNAFLLHISYSNRESVEMPRRNPVSPMRESAFFGYCV